MVRNRRCRRRGFFVRIAETSYGKGSVEVLPDLRDYPISDRPRVDPGNGTALVATLDENPAPKSSERERHKLEGVAGYGGTGEQAHHKLVGRRAMEPPLEVRS